MNRRGFLGAILAAAAAPAIVRADSLMRIVPRDLLVDDGTITEPLCYGDSLLRGEIGRYNGVVFHMREDQAAYNRLMTEQLGWITPTVPLDESTAKCIEARRNMEIDRIFHVKQRWISVDEALALYPPKVA